MKRLKFLFIIALIWIPPVISLRYFFTETGFFELLVSIFIWWSDPKIVFGYIIFIYSATAIIWAPIITYALWQKSKATNQQDDSNLS